MSLTERSISGEDIRCTVANGKQCDACYAGREVQLLREKVEGRNKEIISLHKKDKRWNKKVRLELRCFKKATGVIIAFRYLQVYLRSGHYSN